MTRLGTRSANHPANKAIVAAPPASTAKEKQTVWASNPFSIHYGMRWTLAPLSYPGQCESQQQLTHVGGAESLLNRPGCILAELVSAGATIAVWRQRLNSIHGEAHVLWLPP